MFQWQYLYYNTAKHSENRRVGWGIAVHRKLKEWIKEMVNLILTLILRVDNPEKAFYDSEIQKQNIMKSENCIIV